MVRNLASSYFEFKRDKASGSKLNAIVTGGETPNEEKQASIKYCRSKGDLYESE